MCLSSPVPQLTEDIVFDIININIDREKIVLFQSSWVGGGGGEGAEDFLCFFFVY